MTAEQIDLFGAQPAPLPRRRVGGGSPVTRVTWHCGCGRTVRRSLYPHRDHCMFARGAWPEVVILPRRRR